MNADNGTVYKPAEYKEAQKIQRDDKAAVTIFLGKPGFPAAISLKNYRFCPQ